VGEIELLAARADYRLESFSAAMIIVTTVMTADNIAISRFDIKVQGRIKGRVWKAIMFAEPYEQKTKSVNYRT
jgi:hypothetical protein